MKKLYTEKQLKNFAFSELEKEFKKNCAQSVNFYSKDENEDLEHWTKRLNDIRDRDRSDIYKIVKSEEKQPIKKMREIYKQKNPKAIFKTLCYYCYKNYINDLERAKNGVLEALATELPKNIKIEVTWAKSKTWGANPTAEAWTSEYLGESRSIGGCGYDKESTAIAEPFNRSKQMTKIAVIAKYICHRYENLNFEQKKNLNILYCYDYGVRFSIFHNNGIYWESGVGASSFMNCIKTAGYKMDAETHPKYFDFYSLSKRG